MAGVKISALPPVSSALLTDFFPVVQAGVTSQETLQQVLTLFDSNIQLASPSQVTGLVGTYLPLAGGTMTGIINMGSQKIQSLTDPTLAQDAATKNYVDTVAQGLNILPACQAATTANLTATYANGSSGVGATLTNSGAQAALVIDGYTVQLNDAILVKNQSTTFQNGVYTCTNQGSNSTNWVLTRATYYNTVADINPGDTTFVNYGTTNTATAWVETATVVTIGTSAISFSPFGTVVTYPIAISLGGTGVTSVTSAPTASAWAGWDANKNLSGNSLLAGYATTATAASTTTLVVGSAQQQYFTGTTTQTVLLPVTSTLALGQSFTIVNNSTGVVTVQSSGGNTIQAMAANSVLTVTCILLTGTTAASWNYEYALQAGGSGIINSGTTAQLAYYAGAGNTLSGGGLGNIAGTTTNDNAGSGNVGQYVSSNVAYGSAVSISTGTPANVTSISLTAGDWDVWGSAGANSTSVLSYGYAGLNSTSATLPDNSLVADIGNNFSVAPTFSVAAVPTQRFSLASTTTIYLVINATGTGTLTAFGNLAARRRR